MEKVAITKSEKELVGLASIVGWFKEADTANVNPLSAVVWIAKAVSELERLKEELVKPANDIYTQLSKDRAGQIKLEEFAILSKNSAKGTWKYPKKVQDLIDEAEQVKKIAQETGAAVKKEGTLDPAKNCLFRIQILDLL